MNRHHRNNLPTQPSKARAVALMFLMVLNFFLNSPRLNALVGIQYVKLALWCLLALAVWQAPRQRPHAKLRHRSFLNWWALTLGLIYIFATIGAGLLDGFGKSPYDHSFRGLAANCLLMGTGLIAREIIRSYLVNSLTREENYLVFGVIALLMALSDFTPEKFTELKSTEEVVRFTGQYFAPELSKSVLAAYLAYLGGAVPAIIYLGAVLTFHWVSPILPDLKWITAGFVGILCPVFSLMAIQSIYTTQAKELRRRDYADEGAAGWIATSLVSIAIIWFAVGVFPVYPTVVATGSMKPGINPGDITLVRKVSDVKELQTGDVIQFKRDGILISHRVIQVLSKHGAVSFRTKGDNNSGPDFGVVEPKQVKGKVIQVLPKLGWPTLLLKSKRDVPIDQISGK